MQPFVSNDPQQPHQVFVLQLPENERKTLNFMSQWLLEEKSSAYRYSRHDCSFQQEGLSFDITFDYLYCHLLADILSLINSCNSESAAFVKATVTL